MTKNTNHGVTNMKNEPGKNPYVVRLDICLRADTSSLAVEEVEAMMLYLANDWHEKVDWTITMVEQLVEKDNRPVPPGPPHMEAVNKVPGFVSS